MPAVWQPPKVLLESLTVFPAKFLANVLIEQVVFRRQQLIKQLLIVKVALGQGKPISFRQFSEDVCSKVPAIHARSPISGSLTSAAVAQHNS
jgi:hypothetical protein